MSVIISAYSEDRIEDVRDVIRSLKSQTYKNLEKIIVVDRNRNTFNILMKYINNDVNLVFHESPPGLSGARNTGIANANGDLISFLDDDSIASETWAETIMEDFDESADDVIAIGGIIRPIWIGREPIWLPRELYWTIGCTYDGFRKEKGYVERLFGSNMVFRKEIFEIIGGFNPDLGRINNRQLVGEETELFIKISNYGYKVLYDPDAVIYHKIFPYRVKLIYILQRTFQYGNALMKSRVNFNVKSTKQSQENSMISYILKTSIPQRIIKILSLNNVLCNLFQLCILLLAISIALLGMIFGYIKSKL